MKVSNGFLRLPYSIQSILIYLGTVYKMGIHFYIYSTLFFLRLGNWLLIGLIWNKLHLNLTLTLSTSTLRQWNTFLLKLSNIHSVSLDLSMLRTSHHSSVIANTVFWWSNIGYRTKTNHNIHLIKIHFMICLLKKNQRIYSFEIFLT